MKQHLPQLLAVSNAVEGELEHMHIGLGMVHKLSSEDPNDLMY